MLPAQLLIGTAASGARFSSRPALPARALGGWRREYGDRSFCIILWCIPIFATVLQENSRSPAVDAARHPMPPIALDGTELLPGTLRDATTFRSERRALYSCEWCRIRRDSFHPPIWPQKDDSTPRVRTPLLRQDFWPGPSAKGFPGICLCTIAPTTRFAEVFD